MTHRKRFCLRLLIIIIVIDHNGITVTTNEITGAEYLQNAMRDLHQINLEHSVSYVENTRKINDAFSVNRADIPSLSDYPSANNRISTNSHHVPPISLTKSELSAIYQAAITDGSTVTLNHDDYDGAGSEQIHAAVHEIQSAGDNVPSAQHLSPDTDSLGYYYYYYPLKSFLTEVQNEFQKEKEHSSHSALSATHSHTTLSKGKRRPALHAHHTHQHNVNVEPIKAIMEMSHHKNKALDPLFMAISGFVGMAVMFMFTMVFLPKFTGNKNKKKKQRSFYNRPYMSTEQITSFSAALSGIIERYNKMQKSNIVKYK